MLGLCAYCFQEGKQRYMVGTHKVCSKTCAVLLRIKIRMEKIDE